MASPGTALSSTLNSTIVSEDAGHELLSIEDDISLSSFTTNDRIAPELRKERCDKVETFILSGESYFSAGKESDKRCKRKKGVDSDLSQKRSRESPALDISPIESRLKTETETSKVKTIDTETETDLLRTTYSGPHNNESSITSPAFSKEVQLEQHVVRREFVHQTSRSTRPAEEQHFYRDLGLIKIEDMDCVTRHDRLRTLKRIIKRGDELTAVEKAQLAELEAKGTRVRGRDLSRIDVADMDSRTRKIRRGVLRKNVHRYRILNEAEMKQLKGFGLNYKA